MLEKEREKKDHYQDLKEEVQTIWNGGRVSVIPVVISRALGTVSKDLKICFDKIWTPGIISLLQKACLFGKAKIL